MASLSFLYLLASLFLLSVDHVVLASLLLEDGYAVTTVINGDEHQINPYSILPLFESSDLIVLDSSRSTFYTISLASSSQGGAVKKLAGNGVAGYADGELGSAKFNKPKSFAVDFKGNVYVADRFKHTIRKISKSGVSTIAGGYSQTTGKIDGPAQNASFSDDFELAFIPERCAILISDHGNRLVRQIKLKAEDCTHGSQSGVGMTSFWVIGLGLGLSCLLGMVVGFVCRPYVTSRGGLRSLTCNTTWNRCLTSLEKRVWMLCFVIRNVVVSSTPFKLLKRLIILSLSTIPLMFQVRRVEPKASCNKLPSLLDSDNSNVTYFKNTTRPLLDTDYYPESCEMTKLPLDSLKDLMIFDDVVDSRDVANTTNVEVEDLGKETTHVLAGGDEKIECLIRANMFGFMEKQTKTTFLDESLAACCNGQAKLKAF